MSDTFFTRSGSSPGDADSTRPSSQLPPQKKPIKRAFTGMAGSPLARIEEPIAAPAVATEPLEPLEFKAQPAPVLTPNAYAARKRRAAATDAREAAKAKVRERAQIPPTQRKIEDQKEKWRGKVIAEAIEREEKEIAKKAKRQNDGSVMNDAPRGQGRLITGGYSPTKIAAVVAAHDRDEYGRRAKQQGAGAIHDEEGGKIVGTRSGAKYLETSTPRFHVKLGQDYDQRGPLASMIGSFDNGVLQSYVIEIVPDTDVFSCGACEFKTDWWSTMVHHFEGSVHEEAVRFEAAMKRASAAAEALEEMVLIAPANTSPMTILRPVMGTHVRWFEGFKRALRKAARKRKATGQCIGKKEDAGKRTNCAL